MTISKILISLIVGLIIILLLISLTRFFAAKSKPKLSLGIQSNGELQTCPKSPNCVSSFADSSDKEHYISPLKVDQESWSKLKTDLKKYFELQPRYSLQKESKNYLYYIQKSKMFGFIDDVEILLLPEKGELHFRSSSRLGYDDLGVNRKRIEEVLKEIKLRESK